MVEEFLQKGEKVKLEENCNYTLKEGKIASNRAVIALTNKRFLVFKRSAKLNSLVTMWIPILVIVPLILSIDVGILEAGLIGAVVGGLIGLVGSILVKDKGKLEPDPELSINLKDISVSENKASDLVVKGEKEEICQFTSVKKEDWLKALKK